MKIDRLEIELEDDADLFDGAGVVPFYMKEEKEDGEGVLYIEAYSGIEDVLNEFASSFAKSPFTDKALSYLNDTISPYLEEKGYVRREANVSDKRSFLVFPTDKMLEIFPLVSTITREWNERICEDIPSDELEAFFSVLSKMEQKAKAIVGGTLTCDKF